MSKLEPMIEKLCEKAKITPPNPGDWVEVVENFRCVLAWDIYCLDFNLLTLKVRLSRRLEDYIDDPWETIAVYTLEGFLKIHGS